MAPTVGQFESTASTSAADQPQAEGLPDGKFTVGTSSTSLFGNEKSATVHGKLFTVGAVSVSGQTTSVPGVVVNRARRAWRRLKSQSDSGSLNTLSGDPDVGTGRAKFAPVIDTDTAVKYGLFTINPSSSFSSQNCTPPKPADEPVTLGWLSTTVPSKFVFGTSSCTNPFYFGNETLKDIGTSQQDSCTKAAEVNGQTQDFAIQTSDCGTQTSDFDMLALSSGTQMLSVGVQTSSANVQTLTSSTQTSDFGTQADFNLLETSSLQLQVTELQRKVELSSRTFLNEIEILKTMLKLKTLFHEKEHYDYCNMLSYRGLQTTLNSSSCALGCCQHEVAKCVLDRVARGHLAVTGSKITEHTSCDTRNIDEEVVHCNISECSQNQSYESESIQQHKEDVWEKAETVVDGDEDRTAQKLKHGCDTSDQVVVISMEKNSTPSDVPKNEQVELLKKEVNSLKDELLALKNQLDILKEESEPKVNQECADGQHAVQHPVLLSQVNTADVLDKRSEFRTPGVQRIDC